MERTARRGEVQKASGTGGKNTVRFLARQAEVKLASIDFDFALWSKRRVLNELVSLVNKKNLRACLPWSFAKDIPFCSEDYTEAFDRMLAQCEQARINPTDFLRCIVEVSGTYAVQQGYTLKPGHFHGDKMAARYDQWLDRQHSIGHRSDTGYSKGKDKRLAAESAFIAVLGAHVLYRSPIHESLKDAKLAARQVDFDYTPCPLRRLIALADYLHRIYPSIPDSIVLHDGWKCREVIRAAFRLVK